MAYELKLLTGNANRLKIFRDGIARTVSFSTTVPASTANNTQPVWIGRGASGSAGALDGRLGGRPW